MREELVRLADKLDQEGKHDLAAAVDKALQATAAGRPKAPLKNLDDGVKKDLLKFLHKVKENIADSMDALEELFGRLRYFDIIDDVKDLGLDKTLKELVRVHDAADGAFTAMYARTHGKKPSNSDLEQMAEDFGPDRKTDRNPLEFFENQSKHSNPDELAEREEEGLRDMEQEMYPDSEEDDDGTEEELQELMSFWGSDEESFDAEPEGEPELEGEPEPESEDEDESEHEFEE